MVYLRIQVTGKFTYNIYHSLVPAIHNFHGECQVWLHCGPNERWNVRYCFVAISEWLRTCRRPFSESSSII